MNQYSVTKKPISHLKFRMNVLVLGLAVIPDCLLPYCFHICVFLLHRQLRFMKRAVFQQWNTYFNWVIFKYLFFGALNFCFQGQELTLTLNSLHNFLSARLLILLVTLLQMSFPGFCSWKRWVETLSEEGGGGSLWQMFLYRLNRSHIFFESFPPVCQSCWSQNSFSIL